MLFVEHDIEMHIKKSFCLLNNILQSTVLNFTCHTVIFIQYDFISYSCLEWMS